MRREIAQVSLAAPAVGQAVAWREHLEGLQRRRDALERDVLGGEAQIARPEEVCAALPPDSVLVDYLGTRRNSLAIVVEDCQIRTVDLGASEDIAAAVAHYRELLGDPGAGEHRVDEAGARVRERVWDPLEIARERVFIAGDGPSAVLSFAALPSEGGGYLIESFDLRYLESAAELSRDAKPGVGAGALVVGGLDFGPTAAPELVASRGDDCLTPRFAPLPGAATEAGAVASLLRKNRVLRGQSVDRLGGVEGTEEALVDRLPGHRVVHLATHGFLAGEQCLSALQNDVGYDPMVLSGIALAGANRSGTEVDGVLTAAELATVDLSGTALVVLSACNTGLGYQSSGDGVLGLRRAFFQAGAQSLIMSLWPVGDEPTAALMEQLYLALRRRNVTPAEALRRAQLHQLAWSRSQGRGGRPQDWAGFIVSGDLQ